MNLSQLLVLKTAIIAEADPIFTNLRVSGATGAMADWLNGDSTFAVWRNVTPASDIMDAITWANLTPKDIPDGSGLSLQLEYRCQGKQLSLQILLQGRDSLSTGKASIRQGFSDALQNVPAGAGGAMLDAGWLGAGKVKAAITRFASRAEKLFATGIGTAAQPGALVWEGTLRSEDIILALGA